MQQECRYICQRAANAIISEVGSYRVSTDALHGINQFLDEFLVRLLTHGQSLDLSRIKASVFHLLPSTLGKNAIVEAELEVKTFTETEVIDYDVYEKMRSLGPPFPLSQCLPLLRDRCFEFCTLADKDDQQAWIPQPSTTQDILISPIVAIYVTTVLEHMAEYILTAVAMTAETEETDYVRIKELFLALVDDMQVGLVFQTMDLRDKMEKRSFPHGYISRSSMLPPPTNASFPRNSSNSMNPGNNFLGDIVFDDLELHYDDDDDTSVQHQQQHRQTSLSNYSMASNNRQRPLSMMTNSTSQTSFSASSSNKKAYKVFKNDHHHSTSPLASNLDQPAVYDPDSPTMNFEDLIRSGNTMRVSLTPHRLKSIEVKDQMAEDPAPAKPAWKRRSSSVPRMSTSSSGSSSRPQTPTPTAQRHHRAPSPLVAAPTNEQQQKPKVNTQRSMSPTPSAAPVKTKTTPKPDHRFEQPRDAPKPPSTSSSSSDTTGSNKSIEKSLPTPTSSTSSRQSKHRAPIPVPVPVPVVEPRPAAVKSTLSESPITTTSEHTTACSTSSTRTSTSDAKETALPTPSATTTAPNKTPTPSTVRPPTLRRGSLSNRKSRENLRRQREKEAKAGSDTATSTTSANDATATTTTTKQQKPARSSKSSPSLTEQQQSSSDSLDSLDANATTTLPPPTTTTNAPQRPSSYVAKRASMAGASRRQSLHESYAIDVTVENSDTTSTSTSTSTNNNNNNNNDTTSPSTPPSSTVVARSPSPAAGTVGNTIKQLDKVVQQKSSSSSIQSIATPTTASRKASLASISSTSETSLSLPTQPPALQQKSASRKSAVLDRVLQFERAYSLDDTNTSQQRRASSYIPRRERFMYLQRDPHALEKKPTTPNTSNSNINSTAVVRPGTSATIAAAAARFAAGVSMAIQTEPEVARQAAAAAAPPALMITDDDGKHHHQHSPTIMTPTVDHSDAVSEHGVVDGDEEWFLPDDEWEDVQEQENAVAEWLLGEA
ncbi:hypothetical protein BCR42DRAFT_497014 [Absidia repens]|uniref:Uncharacterized protein n=1 Tax=Absidia repens TaxID=90262 RepID=A0A1X2HXL2_9FUNG|nr:hypothetical protein BCR42DRAFT_497014 [Absidia repens]